MTSTISVPPRFQGPTGFGQGGWTAARLVQAMSDASPDRPRPQDVTVAIRAPIPLDTDLTVVPPADTFDGATVGESAREETWRLVDPAGAVILEATRWEPDWPGTAAVSLAVAEKAGARFPLPGDLHPVPHCFSCGLQPETMSVQAGPLGDGRFATSWTVPDWAAAETGVVDGGVVWAALDCAAAIYAGCAGGIRRSVTAQLTVEILSPFVVGQSYALVAWDGNWTHGGWDGRKRGAASAAFDRSGRCVARSTSFWIALE